MEQQDIISIDVIIEIESHIDQNFTSYDNLKCYFALKKAKIPPKMPILVHFSIIEKSKFQICGWKRLKLSHFHIIQWFQALKWAVGSIIMKWWWKTSNFAIFHQKSTKKPRTSQLWALRQKREKFLAISWLVNPIRYILNSSYWANEENRRQGPSSAQECPFLPHHPWILPSLKNWESFHNSYRTSF